MLPYYYYISHVTDRQTDTVTDQVQRWRQRHRQNQRDETRHQQQTHTSPEHNVTRHTHYTPHTHTYTLAHSLCTLTTHSHWVSLSLLCNHVTADVSYFNCESHPANINTASIHTKQPVVKETHSKIEPRIFALFLSDKNAKSLKNWQ